MKTDVLDMTVIVDLDEKRAATLASTRAQIAEMEKVKRRLALGGPAHALVKNIIDRLKAKADKLSSAPVRVRALSAARRRRMN